MASVEAKQSSSGWFLQALFLVFLVLKITGQISWSWWWVTAPLWGGYALIALVVLVVIPVVVIIEAHKRKRRAEQFDEHLAKFLRPKTD